MEINTFVSQRRDQMIFGSPCQGRRPINALFLIITGLSKPKASPAGADHFAKFTKMQYRGAPVANVRANVPHEMVTNAATQRVSLETLFFDIAAKAGERR